MQDYRKCVCTIKLNSQIIQGSFLDMYNFVYIQDFLSKITLFNENLQSILDKKKLTFFVLIHLHEAWNR